MLATSLRKSIARKIAATVAVAVACAVAAGSAVSAWREASRRFETTTQELSGIASALSATISQPVAEKQKRKIALGVRGIAGLPRVRFVRVLDTDGRRLAAFGHGVIVARDIRDAGVIRSSDPFAFLSLSTYPVVVPIIHGGRKVGTLEILADLSALRTAALESLTAAFFIGLLAATLGLIVSLRLQSAITKPITALTGAMREIRDGGRYGRRIARRSSDEVGEMVDAFNAMLAEIQSRQRALEDHRDHLEDEVHARTIDLEAAKREAETANAAKSDFLAAMSHEIRTPMNGMVVMAELLAAGDLDARSRQRCNVILKSTQSLLAIINDVLDLSKIEAGKLELDCVPLRPAEVVDDVVSLFAERAASKNLDLACYVAPWLAHRVKGDPVRLNQVLSNLVNNALKFTESGGVLISATSEPFKPGWEMVSIAVRDTGIGIAADKLEAIFEVFSQAERSTTRRFGGTGIGLAVCRRLVAAMDGQIRVESAPGEGATFIVEIPLEVVAASAVPDKAAGLPDKRARTALVKLDDAQSAFALRQMLSDHGVRIAWSGDAARADILIADAAQLDRLAKSRAGGARDQVRLAVSAMGETAGTQLLAEEGVADGVVERPVGIAATRQTVSAAVRGRAALKELHAQNDFSADQPAVQFANAHILAAEDSALNREVLIEVVGRLGIQLTCVENGAEAVDALAVPGANFDLVFMDGSMPVMDGLTATKAIRAREEREGGRRVPIVALTAQVVGKPADTWFAAGADAFLSKPYTLADVEACLSQWLSGKVVPSAQTGHSGAGDAPPPPASASAASFADLPLIDDEAHNALKEFQAPGTDLVARVASLFLAHAPEHLDRLHTALDHEPGKVAATAHALKSLCRSAGAARLGGICDRIEHGAHDGSALWEGARGELDGCFEATCAALTRHRDGDRGADEGAAQGEPKPALSA